MKTPHSMEREVLYAARLCGRAFGRLVFERRERWPPSERGLLFSTGWNYMDNEKLQTTAYIEGK